MLVTDLEKAFSRVAKAIDQKAALPSIQCARWADNTLTGTNLQTVVTVPLDCVAGECLVKPAEMRAKLKAFADCTEITLSRGPNHIELRSGSRKIRVGILPLEDFPSMPADTSKTTIVPEFFVPFRSVLAAVSDSRDHLRQIKLTGGYAVATDGHRIHAVKLRDTVEASVPPSVAELLSKAEPSDWIVSPKRCTVGDTTWIQPTEGFPPWEQVVPKGHKSKADVSYEHLVVALNAINAADKRGEQHGSLTFGVDSIAIETEEVSDTVDSQIEGEKCKIGMNLVYLRDAVLACQSGVITIRYGTPLDPVLIEQGDFLAVVMPVRL